MQSSTSAWANWPSNAKCPIISSQTPRFCCFFHLLLNQAQPTREFCGISKRSTLLGSGELSGTYVRKSPGEVLGRPSAERLLLRGLGPSCNDVRILALGSSINERRRLRSMYMLLVGPNGGSKGNRIDEYDEMSTWNNKKHQIQEFQHHPCLKASGCIIFLPRFFRLGFLASQKAAKSSLGSPPVNEARSVRSI